MIQKGRLIFWEVTVWVIVTEFHMITCIILNGY